MAVPNWFLELSKNMLTPQIGSIRVSLNRCTSNGQRPFYAKYLKLLLLLLLLLLQQSADGDMELVALKGICKHCLKHAQRAFKTMNPIFQR